MLEAIDLGNYQVRVPEQEDMVTRDAVDPRENLKVAEEYASQDVGVPENLMIAEELATQDVPENFQHCLHIRSIM